MTRALVLIVEDESDIAGLIEYHLAREGHRTRIAPSGRAALEAIAKERPDLVVLDIMLPDLDGLEVLRRLKRDSGLKDVPVMMVSAKGEESDVVVGLELGAEDYVTKPFSPRVLMARVKAVLRRRPGDAAPDATGALTLGGGDVTIDPSRHIVRVDGESVELTLTEYRLLEYLAARPGFVRTRDQIVAAVRGEGTVLSSRAIDVHIAALRRKLGHAGGLIETVRGVGYRCGDESTVRSAASPSRP